jgi:HEAT repeat protein
VISKEIIDSLKNIGTENAVGVLQSIALYNPLFKPRRLKELKMFAVQGIGKIKSEKAREALENLTKGSDSICRKEAAKILERMDHGKDGA